MTEHEGNLEMSNACEITERCRPDHTGSDLNEDLYRHHLSSLSLTPEEESALLQALWAMMRAFVDLGFGQDSVQMVFGAAAKSTPSPAQLPLQDYGPGEEDAVDINNKSGDPR